MKKFESVAARTRRSSSCSSYKQDLMVSPSSMEPTRDRFGELSSGQEHRASTVGAKTHRDGADSGAVARGCTPYSFRTCSRVLSRPVRPVVPPPRGHRRSWLTAAGKSLRVGAERHPLERSLPVRPGACNLSWSARAARRDLSARCDLPPENAGVRAFWGRRQSHWVANNHALDAPSRTPS